MLKFHDFIYFFFKEKVPKIIISFHPKTTMQAVVWKKRQETEEVILNTKLKKSVEQIIQAIYRLT